MLVQRAGNEADAQYAVSVGFRVFCDSQPVSVKLWGQRPLGWVDGQERRDSLLNEESWMKKAALASGRVSVSTALSVPG